MHFIQSHRANVSQPINLDHVVTFKKDGGTGPWAIWFHTLSGETVRWKYGDDKANRDLDYAELIYLTEPTNWHIRPRGQQ